MIECKVYQLHEAIKERNREGGGQIRKKKDHSETMTKETLFDMVN